MGLATTGGAEVEGESQVKKSRRAIGTGGRLAGLRLRLRLRLAGWLLYSRGVAQLVEQRTSNPQIRCSSPGLLAALSRGLSRKRLQVSALPRQWIRLFNGLTV